MQMIGIQHLFLYYLTLHMLLIPIFKNTGSLLSIHNLEHQGKFYKGAMDVLGVSASLILPRLLAQTPKISKNSFAISREALSFAAIILVFFRQKLLHTRYAGIIKAS